MTALRLVHRHVVQALIAAHIRSEYRVGDTARYEDTLTPKPLLRSRAENSSNQPVNISKSRHPINSVDDWHRLAPPQAKVHWKDGRSAKELAMALFRQGVCSVPAELQSLLSSSPTLGSVTLLEGWPEHAITLDSFGGKARQADLAAIGAANDGKIAITIEAKADESFGNLIADELRCAADNPRSNVPKRIDALAQGMFGTPAAQVGHLRYQLLHAAAATLIFAAGIGAAAAVLVIYEFRGPSCSHARLSRNAADLAHFLQKVNPAYQHLHTGLLQGPFRVPGLAHIPSRIPLLVGKIESTVS